MSYELASLSTCGCQRTRVGQSVDASCAVLTGRSHAGEAEVAVGGRDLSNWSFDASNVLAWADDAGYTAWLQFTVLPGGPVFMGTLHPSGEEATGAGMAQLRSYTTPSTRFC